MLCDDSLTVRAAFSRILEADPGLRIVAQRRVRELRDILRERVIINQVSRGWREVETT